MRDRASWWVCNIRAHRQVWRVVVRQANYSTFNGRHRTPSAYSEVTCLACRDPGHTWRTKAAYVATLRDITPQEFAAWRGTG